MWNRMTYLMTVNHSTHSVFRPSFPVEVILRSKLRFYLNLAFFRQRDLCIKWHFQCFERPLFQELYILLGIYNYKIWIQCQMCCWNYEPWKFVSKYVSSIWLVRELSLGNVILKRNPSKDKGRLAKQILSDFSIVVIIACFVVVFVVIVVFRGE